MPYSPSTFVDQSTIVPVSAAELNKIGTGMSKMAYGPDGTVGQVPAADGNGGFTWQKIGNAQVASNAALDISKLANYPSDATKYLRGDGTWAAATASTELDYSQITTSPSAVTATTEGTAVAVITGNSVTYDGTSLYVEFFTPQIQPSGAITVHFVLLRDSSILGTVNFGATGSSDSKAVTGKVKDTPSAGSHTYSLAVWVSSGSVNFNAGVGGSGTHLTPAYLRVIKA